MGRDHKAAIGYIAAMATPAQHLETLNAAQRKAVTTGEALPEKGFSSPPLLIIAGAGTGKTSTLAHRVAHLILNKVDPARILLLTFSRRASVEMRRRAHEIVRTALEDTLGGKAHALTQRLNWAGTFHSVGNRLLRHYAPHLGLDPAFTVIDRGDSADLLDGLRQELGMAAKEQRFPRKDTCLAIYSYRVNTRRPLKETLELQYPWCLQWEEDLTKLFRAYVERKQKLGILDYDDLLLYWHILMAEPALARHVSGHFDHVLVDEYQDTNRLQGEILQNLKPDGRGVTVVGDDAQAIYSFRAATVENILEFPQRFTPPAEVVPLAQNYRSTQPVLDLANALMADAPRQHRKHLIAVRGGGALPRLVTVDDLATQAEYVCSQVLSRRETGIDLRRQAVLFRSASHSDLLEVELSRRRIPFVKYGGLKFLEAAHIKDLLAVLRWTDNPRNALAAFRVLQLLPGMGPANARRCLDEQAAAGGGWAALRTFAAPAAAARDYTKLLDLINVLAEPGRAWAGQMRLLREWYQPHLERLYEQTHTRIGDLEQLEQLSQHYPTRERFITELTLDPPQASGDLAGTPLRDEDYLVLSTIHSAKGMEWDTVFLLNVVDGSFPSEFATGRPELIDEERRLLYVALTRARNELQLVSPLKFPVTQQAPRGDAHVYGGRSRFLNEKVLKTLQQSNWQGTAAADGALKDSGVPRIDVAAKLKDLW
jgi:DNA helicase-2/ATP-dependent DNA helicase PcrA